VALAPAEVHALEHLRPVGGLGAAGAGADGEDRALGVVLAGEQQEGALALELGAQGVGLAGEIGLRAGVRRVREQVEELLEVGGPLLEGPPGVDLVPQALRLADDLLRPTLVVPEAGLDRAGVELRDARFLGG
jgi:hypothetical protein